MKNKYLLLFAIYFILTSCGSEGGRTGLVPAPTVRSASAPLDTPRTYDLVRLTQAMFNAAPGSLYLEYMSDYLVSGMSLLELADLLSQSESFRSATLYPSALSSQQFSDRFVENLLGNTVNRFDKTALAEAIVNYLDNGGSRGGAIWTVASLLKEVPATDPHWGRASIQFSNKVDVAYYYSVTTSQSAQDLGILQAVTRAVTDDPATVTAAKNQRPTNIVPSWASLGIAGSSRQITISWTKGSTKAAATGGSSYNLYWSTTPGVTKNTGTKIANVISPYTHTGLANDQMYYYMVTEVIGGMEGDASLEVATAPKATAPVMPTGMSITPSSHAVQITLDPASPLTTKFSLYYATDATLSNRVKLVNAFEGATSFQHFPLENGTLYYYVITAGMLEGESPQSGQLAAQPLSDEKAANYVATISQAKLGAPNSITALAGNQRVNLSWNMPTDHIPTVFDPETTPTKSPVLSAFNIYWATSRIIDLAQANKITLPVTSALTLPMTFVHNTELSNDTPYYYVITAVAETDANGSHLQTAKGDLLSFESPASSQISVTPKAKPSAAPTGLAATSGSKQIILTWGPSTTAGSTYRIYASTSAPVYPKDLIAPQNQIAITSTTTYTHTGLQNGYTYYYVVTAVAEGESPPSALVGVSLR